MFSLLYVTLSAFVVLTLSVNGLTTSKQAPAASLSSFTPDHIMSMLNVTKGSPEEAMLNKLRAMNASELHTLMNQTMAHLGGNSTSREGRMFGYGGSGDGNISPLLLALLIRDRGYGGGYGGGAGGGSPIFMPAPPPAPAPSPSGGGNDDLAAFAALTLLGLAVISRFPTQG
ncbi:hypothetical protein RvY_07276 [Ramazzottius varieornatus]|uniref:Uncharacterized protein n=1 Tax=Ramazzottius varieornatus TaxID=947166 RepID=A0A1D1VB14_RAMVA|nr:hypothetical protein RvY_07276 [Ramazzottius varieornatus]